MQLRGSVLLCLFASICATLNAQAISGTILIKKKLTRPSVTTSVSIYQRGTVVGLGTDAEQDPIAYERSRVAIYLEGPAPASDTQENVAEEKIGQLNRRFVPDMLVVRPGSTVFFPNMDPIFHNVYSLSKPKSFDLGSYDKGQTRKVTFLKPGIVEIYCHLHPNMKATVVVAPNRWYAKPDRDGNYRISNVPPGRYTIVAWHRSAGFFRKSVVVNNDRDSTVDFFIPLDVEPDQPDQHAHEASQNAGPM